MSTFRESASLFFDTDKTQIWVWAGGAGKQKHMQGNLPSTFYCMVERCSNVGGANACGDRVVEASRLSRRLASRRRGIEAVVEASLTWSSLGSPILSYIGVEAVEAGVEATSRLASRLSVEASRPGLRDDKHKSQHF